MEITVREFRSEDTKDAIAIWNEVVDQGKAFPQLEDLGVEDGEAFLKSSLIQVLRSMKMMRSWDFIFFTRIILADADTSVMPAMR